MINIDTELPLQNVRNAQCYRHTQYIMYVRMCLWTFACNVFACVCMLYGHVHVCACMHSVRVCGVRSCFRV